MQSAIRLILISLAIAFIGGTASAGPNEAFAPVRRPVLACPDVPAGQLTKPLNPEYERSPFGFLDAVTYKGEFFSWNRRLPELMEELHARWVKGGGIQAFIWKRMQTKDAGNTYGPFVWDEQDCLVRYLQANNIHLLGNLRASEPNAGSPDNERKTPRLPRDIEGYKRFVSSVVERYDNDGIDDMPGLRFAVKYWLIEEEPFMREYWAGSAEDYAVTLSVAYDAIKEADPEAVVIAGALYFDDLGATREFAERFFKKLSLLGHGHKKYDMLDVHWFFKRNMETSVQYRRIKMMRDAVWEIEKRHFPENSPFIVTETAGKYSGIDDQPKDMLKRYVYALSLGAEKVFWTALGGAEGATDPFSQAAIVEKGRSGLLRKRPAYHTFRLMATKLEGADLLTLKSVEETGGLYVFRVMKGGRPMWVAWNDNPASAGYLLKGVPYKAVRTTVAIPRGNSFPSETSDVQSGSVRLTLDDRPVFIEDVSEPQVTIDRSEVYDDSAGVREEGDRGPRSRQGGAMNGAGPMGQRGRCGDGYCGPVEREKGVCPEDCR